MAANVESRSAPGRRSDTDPPQRLGKYVIEKRLGAGGMGTVFLALDSELNRTVALKVLPRERAANPTLVKRFKSEGQAAARLEHDNIVKVFDFGEIDGHLYLALEYVDGVDAQELVLKRGVVPVRRSIEIIRQVAAALQHAYGRNIVHRDIKPSNLMIRRDGLVKLADMGLARAIDETSETSITRDGMTVGTVDYMAPEQARDSKQADIRSDIYSLGCTWYFLLTGSPPFPEGSVTGKLQAHANQPLPDPRQKNERVPEALAAVIQRMTAKRPIDRYQTPDELIEDLKQAHLSRANVDADVLAGLNESAPAGIDAAPSAPGDRASRTATANETTAEPLPQKMKIKKPRRSSPEERAAASRAASHRSGRKSSSGAAPLPQRAENPEALGVSQRRLDPELIKYATFGLVGLVIVGCVGWALVRMNQGSESLGGGGFNPYQAASEPVTPGNSAAHPPPTTGSSPPDSGTAAESVDQTPRATVVNTRPADWEPFPGVEDAERNPSVADVPDWVYAERAASHQGLKTYTVSPADGPGSYPSLSAAIAATPRSGGVVEFVGRGPYHVPPLTISDRESVILRAAPGSSPVLVLTAEPAGAGHGIAMRSGRLEIDGLHLVAAAHDIAGDGTLVAVESGVLYAHNCSLTLAGAAERAATAFTLRGSAPSRGILEHVLIRGQTLSAAALSGPGHELIAGNFLFACGDVPAVAVERPARPAGGAGESLPAGVQLLAGYALSRASALEFSHGPGLEAPDVRVRVRRVAFVAGSDAACGVRLERWPENPAADLEQPRAKGITWQAEDVAWAGWPRLTEMSSPDGAVTATVTDATQWRQFWRVPLESDAVLDLGANHLSDDPTQVTADAMANQLAAAGAPQQRFGPDAAGLPQLPQNMLQRVLAVAGRPRIPAGLGAASGKRVEVDLASQGLKLNSFLNSDACPNGATVVLSGSGVRPIEAVRLRNKSLRLEFQATEGRLIVEPNSRTGGERPPALFQVEGGRIDLVGVHVRIPASATRKYPLRVLHVVGGDFSIQNCLVQGQIGAGAPDVPAVEWTPAARGGGRARNGLIANSMLSGDSAVIGADLDGGLLELRNCILASAADGLDVQLTGAAGRDGHLVVSDCTLSCPGTFLRADTGSSPTGSRLHVFVDHTVFGPSTATGQGGPSVITHPVGAEASGRIVWWEERTAYDRRINRYRRIAGDAADGVQDFTSDWIRPWGPEHVIEALTDPTAVLLAASLPAPERATPENFVLAPNCRAAQYRAGGGPIGARIEAVGPGAVPATPAATPQQTPKPNTPRPNQPDF